jgi:tellurite methyltransferase
LPLPYNKYYKTRNLFGEPYPELISFFEKYPKKGKVLDLGCGQGRDAIALARMGYSVTGIDNSKVGIDQMNRVAHEENLNLTGLVADIFTFDQFNDFDIILLDSMFHFAKKDRKKEVGLIQKIVSEISSGTLVVVCIQDTGNNVKILHEALNIDKKLKRIADQQIKYTFEDKESGYTSETDYRMIIIQMTDPTI